MMRKSFFADIMGQKYLLMQLKFSMKSCWRHKISYPKNLIVKWGRWENCHIGKLLTFVCLHYMQESAFSKTKTFCQRKNICITFILLQHCVFSHQLKPLTATWQSVHHYYPHLLQNAVHYGCGFLTYNVHSLIHLPDDFKRFGSLDYVSCFPFESYLGLLKECVHSGYKPLSQVATHAHHMNENLLNMIKMQKDFICQDYLHNTNDECHLPPALQGQNIKKYRKTLQSNDCIIIPMSTADSTIMVNDYVAKVFDIFEVPPKKFLTVKKYKYVKCCFKQPVKSSIVGIFEIFELSFTFRWIDLEECITKCFIMPF